VALVRGNYDAINSIGRTGEAFVDPEELAPDLWARLAPDIELRGRPDVPDAKVYRGREALKEFWRMLQDTFSELHWEPRELIDLGMWWSRKRGSRPSGGAAICESSRTKRVSSGFATHSSCGCRGSPPRPRPSKPPGTLRRAAENHIPEPRPFPFVAGPCGGAWGKQLLLGFAFAFERGDLQPEVTQSPDLSQVFCGAGGAETTPCLLIAGARPTPYPTILGGFGWWCLARAAGVTARKTAAAMAATLRIMGSPERARVGAAFTPNCWDARAPRYRFGRKAPLCKAAR
jgi:hypothetical protein